MNRWYRRWIRPAALAAVAVCGGGLAVAASTHTAWAGAAAAQCSAADTQIWLGMGGGSGFAGGYGMPLEFSNVSRHACTLYGYPGVSAVRGVRRIGPAATRLNESHALVTLAPGATAHAFLRVTDTGALCGGNGVSADGLKVYAPGQRSAKPVLVPLQVCAHRVTLAIGAVRSGVGIPGYVTQ